MVQVGPSLDFSPKRGGPSLQHTAVPCFLWGSEVCLLCLWVSANGVRRPGIRTRTRLGCTGAGPRPGARKM